MVVEDNRECHSAEVFEIHTKPTFTKFALTFIYDDEGPYFSQRINSLKTMYLLYQAPGGKAEQEETARQAAVRKLYEETSLVAKPRKLKFIAYDGQFDCNIYAYHLPPHTFPERLESSEMTEWMQYSWESFRILYDRKRLTPSLITFFTELRSEEH